MPLLAQWKDPKTHSLIAIWHILEDESFFIKHTGINTNKKHPARRLEHLAGRFLLQLLLPGFPFGELLYTESGRPHLPNDYLHFSISHSYPYVAAIIQEKHPVGIDIQTFQPKIFRVQPRFLSESELSLFPLSESGLTLAWTAKEAAYKWGNLSGVDFIEHMPIHKANIENTNAQLLLDYRLKEVMLDLEGGFFENFAWSKVDQPIP